MKTTKQLAQSLDFNSEIELYLYFVECYLNGNITNSRKLFRQLFINDRKSFIKWLLIEYSGTDVFNHYFNAL